MMALRAMEQLSPLAVLQRGYAIAMDDAGSVIRSVDDTGLDSLIPVILSDGSLQCSVNSIKPEETMEKKKTAKSDSEKAAEINFEKALQQLEEIAGEAGGWRALPG